MGLFNKIFSSNSTSCSQQSENTRKKRANSINNGSMHTANESVRCEPGPLKSQCEKAINTNTKKCNFTQETKDNCHKRDRSKTLDNMSRISRAYTTGQLLSKKTIAMSDFLEYWRKENLSMFHPEKNREEFLSYKPGNGSNFNVNQTLQNEERSSPLKRKSCFKKGTLMEHKKRLLKYQQSRLFNSSNSSDKSSTNSDSNKSKSKSNLSKLLFGSNSKSSGSNDNLNKIPLRKWSSQPNYSVDKECEYDLYGMHDYYDNEDHSTSQQSKLGKNNFTNNDLQLVENTRANSNTSLVSLDSMNSDRPNRILDQFSSDDDTSSDTSSELNIPIISPITSIDETPSSMYSTDYENFKVPPGLEDVAIPKHIHFDKTVFTTDPPQQICSKQPRKGDVVVMKDGIVVVNNEKRKHMLDGSALQSDNLDGVGKGTHGLTVGGRGVLKLLSDEDREALEKNLEWRYYKDLNDINDKNFKPLPDIEIDAKNEEFDSKMFPDKYRNVTWRDIYQRICHLREILPIASIVQQIPEELPDPDTGEIQYKSCIPMITLKNNKPSMIEILTFCDFVSCTIVETLIFDMCDMSLDMFTRIIDAVSVMITNVQILHESRKNKDACENESIKLSFRNTPISEDGFKVLCKFFSTFDFKTVKLSIDLSVAPGVKCNVLRKKNIHCESDKVPDRMSLMLHCNKGKSITEINDFDYDMTFRDADWALFIASIACNPSLKLQQLFLNNCGIYDPNRKNFGFIVQNFFENIAVKTIELGASKKDIEQLFQIAVKSKEDQVNGIPEEKIQKCEFLSSTLLKKLEAGTTKFNIRKLLLESHVLSFPSLKPEIPLPSCNNNASKRNILIDHALLGDDTRSYSINKDEENEIFSIFSKNGSFDHLSEELQNKIKSSHEDLKKLDQSNIRDMIKH
ncbi:hypothetical protein FOG50_02667 [Hanseniaspora uvarum]|nr:hypothetical protein FOG50_02667 [Hanseniaspora uvarum]